MTTETIREALNLWNAGQATEAGWLLYENIPVSVRPYWAAQILDLCRRQTKSPLAVQLVCLIASHRFLWRWGHTAFDAVRRLTLRYEKAESRDEVYGGLLYLA